jgi:hypothetical protein
MRASGLVSGNRLFVYCYFYGPLFTVFIFFSYLLLSMVHPFLRDRGIRRYFSRVGPSSSEGERLNVRAADLIGRS